MEWLVSRLQSFAHAITGVRTLLEEPHARLHLLATVLVSALAFALQISADDWKALLLTVALVWLAEGLNTALEHLCDALHPEHHPLIGKAKDVAAGSVLLMAAVAVIMAGLIFAPYLAA